MATAISSRPNDAAVAAAMPTAQQASLIASMAAKYGLDPKAFFNAIKATIFDHKGTQEEVCAFLIVADHYDLNPFTKEIYAFQKQGGGIMPIVPVDGWAKIINRNPAFDGMAFIDDVSPAGELQAITCRMFRTDRTHPIECTEYMTECVGNSMPWKRWPRRMLRHKAMIQAARYAFSLAGIMDPDEAERAESVGWSQAPAQQGKVGVSNINKLLDAMPAHKPSEAAHVAEEYTDDTPDESIQQPATNALDAILDAMAACKTKQDLDKKYADWQVALPEGVETPLEAESRYAELRESLPDGPSGKGKQKNLMDQ